MESVIQKDHSYCYLCGRSNTSLDKHHVFNAALRKKSEQYGLTVYLCHDHCHIFGPEAVHNNARTAKRLKQDVQRQAMKYYDWNFEDWLKIFGKSYL